MLLKNNTTINAYVLLILVSCFSCLVAFPILPSGDDWGGIGPIDTFTTDLLLPDQNSFFWRPFDKILRHLLIYGGDLWKFHSFVLFGHLLTVIVLFNTLQKLNRYTISNFIFAMFFSISPSITAAIWSYDSITQVYCTLFGVIAARVYLANGVHYTFLSYLLIIVAIFWKESGLGWAFFVPCLGYLKSTGRNTNFHNENLQKLVKQIVVSVILVSLYLILRLMLNEGDISGGYSDRYTVNLSLFTLTKNFLMLLGASIIPVDTLEIISERQFTNSILVIGAFVLFFSNVYKIESRRKLENGNLLPLLLASSALFCMLAPHIILSKVSEMYVYTILAACILLASILTDGVLSVTKNNVRLLGAAFLLVCAFVNVSYNKWINMYDTGLRASAIGAAIAEKSNIKSGESVCIINGFEHSALPNGGSPYSVFLMTTEIAADYGRSFLGSTGWRIKPVFNFSDLGENCSVESREIWSIANGIVTVLAQ